MRTILLACLSLLCVSHTQAQTYIPLHTFAGGTNDGDTPNAGLVLDSNMLYGTTVYGGLSNLGTIFRIGTNGSGFQILHNFTGGSDGSHASGRLALSSNTLFGTTGQGGNGDYGILFKLNTDGSGYEILREFGDNSSGGLVPYASPIILNGQLFGAASAGGDSAADAGTIYKVNMDGTGFQALHSFSGGAEGLAPLSELTLVGSTLFGTTSAGGSGGIGTLFKINTNGTGFSVLHAFSSSEKIFYADFRLAAAGGAVYGQGLDFDGSNPVPLSLFKVNANGTGYQIVTRLPPYPFVGGLTWTGAELLGVGGLTSSSAVFQVHTNGTGYAPIQSISGGPVGDIAVNGAIGYGAISSQIGNRGSIYRLDLRPRLTIARAGASLTASWPAYASSYSLELSTNLNVNWMTVPISPTSDGTNSSITLPITNPAAFFRLRQ